MTPVLSNAGATRGIYGPGIGGDALANNLVGGPVSPTRWFIRFRAEQSSRIASVRLPYLGPDYPGYGAGTGGILRLQLCEDDGVRGLNHPGPVIASAQLPSLARSNNALSVGLGNGPDLVRGRLYHLVYENIDADPVANYFSINNWARLSLDEGEKRQPRWPDADWECGYFLNGKWQSHHLRGWTPIADIEYSNGAHQGMSYGEASYWHPNEPDRDRLVGRICDDAMVREVFTVSGGDRDVMGAGVRTLREHDHGGSLVVSLHDASGTDIGGTSIARTMIAKGPPPTVRQKPSNDDVGSLARWVRMPFVPHCRLRDGARYELRLSSRGCTYWAWVQRRLTREYGYHPSTAFSDGHAEFTLDGGKTWRGLGRVPGQYDLQFYLMTHGGGA